MILNKYQIPVLGCLAELLPVIARPTIKSTYFDTDYAINNWFPNIDVIGEIPITYEVKFDELFVWETPNRLFGIKQDNNLNTYCIYEINPANNTATLFKDFKNEIPNENCGVTYAAGKLWFYGGANKDTSTFSNTLYSYDFATDTVTTHGAGGLARTHCAGCCIGDKVVFIGGQLSNYSYVNQTVTYTISTNTFVTVSTGLPAPRMGGRMIAFNGKGYYLGATAIDNRTNSGKFYEWDPTANTWTQVGYLDTNYRQAHLFPFVFDNNVYVATKNSSGTDSNKPIEVFRYVVGTGLVAAMGLGVTTPVFNTDNHVIEALKTVVSFNGQLYFFAYNEYIRVGEPSYEIYGTMSIVNNSITPVLYVKGVGTFALSSTIEVITQQPDTLSLMQIGILVDSAVTGTANILVADSTLNSRNRYWTTNNPIGGTLNILETDALVIRFQGVKGEWSPWSPAYLSGGGS